MEITATNDWFKHPVGWEMIAATTAGPFFLITFTAGKSTIDVYYEAAYGREVFRVTKETIYTPAPSYWRRLWLALLNR